MAYTIILPAMKDGLQFDYTQLGLLGTGNFIGYLTMAIVGGFLAARFGTRIVITLPSSLMGVTLFMTGLAQNFFAFTMRLLTGLGNGASYVPAMALGSAWFAMHRRRVCHRDRLCRHRFGHHDRQFHRPPGFERLRSGGLALCLGITWVPRSCSLP